MPREEFAAGDAAVRALEQKLQSVMAERMPFSVASAKISEIYLGSTGAWNLKGDDRVLSLMRTAASSAIEEAAQREIDGILADTERDARGRLQALKEELGRIEWLPEGFRSSLGMEISFAIASARGA